MKIAPSVATIHIVDPVQEQHYALSEDAELQLRHLRDGLKAIANLTRGEVADSQPVTEAVSCEDLASIFDVFGIACGAIIDAARFARPSEPFAADMKGRH